MLQSVGMTSVFPIYFVRRNPPQIPTGPGTIQCNSHVSRGNSRDNQLVDAQKSATPLASFSIPITSPRPFLAFQRAMDPSTGFDSGYQQPPTVDIDQLVIAALCARTGTYVYPLTQTMCDNGCVVSVCGPRNSTQ